MINKATESKIKEVTKLEDIIPDFISLKKKGSSLMGCCPSCKREDSLSVSPSKQVYKCFKCDFKGNHAISFLMSFKNMSYPEALRHCADRKNILIEEEVKEVIKSSGTFRDQQLTGSGITDEDQKCQLKNGDQIDRYTAGALDKSRQIVAGNDMLLHFVNLERELTTYTHPDTQKQIPFIRRRINDSEKSLNKNGKIPKYLQPKGSGNHLWIPNVTLQLYQEGTQIETLYLTEGEKKADKLAKHGMIAIGVTGIHNFSFSEEMSNEVKKIIEKCKIKNVVFLLDSDCLDISNKKKGPADTRPRSFFLAVKKFRDYFYHYVKDDIHLKIEFAFLKKNDIEDKGVDDLLVNTLKGKEAELLKDLDSAMIDREGKGEYVTCYNITTMSDHKLKSIWGIQDVQSFAEMHKEVLIKRESFRFERLEWMFNKDGELVELNPMKPEEQYWKVEVVHDKFGNSKKKYYFDYQNIRVFLRNQGFGRIVLPNGKSRFVRIVGKVVIEVNHIYINNFITTHIEDLGEMDVLRMILRGGSQYLGPDKMEKIYEVKLNFIQPAPFYQYLFFKNGFLRVMADEIIEGPLDDLPGYIWQDQIIDFDLNMYKEPVVKVVRKNGKFLAGQSTEGEKSQYLQFLQYTSNFHWGKSYELKQTGNGLKKWIQTKPESLTDQQKEDFTSSFASKIIAMGYLLHQYPKKDEARAVIIMDGLESEVGTSQGGTGKSIFGKALSHVISVITLDAKKKNLADDSFIYEEVDERTRVLFFDDCRVNLDFEHFFGQITTEIKVNGKGVKRYTLPSPKFLFTTNHAINGNGNSFKRRQYLVSFSDWYNEFRTPKDDFDGILFDDWDFQQWNSFYNLVACSIQTFLKFGLQYNTAVEELEKRKLRQQIGENLLEWADVYFHSSGNRNKRVEKKEAYDDFISNYPSDRKFCSIRKFKTRLKLFCEYSKIQFNPNATSGKGGDIKSSGKEYFVIADENFDANDVVANAI